MNNIGNYIAFHGTDKLSGCCLVYKLNCFVRSGFDRGFRV